MWNMTDINKTGTSQVGAISKAQKAQNIFSGTCILLQNNKKLKGGPFGDINFRKKVAVPKKIKRGDPLASAGFLGYVKK